MICKACLYGWLPLLLFNSVKPSWQLSVLIGMLVCCCCCVVLFLLQEALDKYLQAVLAHDYISRKCIIPVATSLPP